MRRGGRQRQAHWVVCCRRGCLASTAPHPVPAFQAHLRLPDLARHRGRAGHEGYHQAPVAGAWSLDAAVRCQHIVDVLPPVFAPLIDLCLLRPLQLGLHVETSLKKMVSYLLDNGTPKEKVIEYVLNTL